MRRDTLRARVVAIARTLAFALAVIDDHQMTLGDVDCRWRSRRGAKSSPEYLQPCFTARWTIGNRVDGAVDDFVSVRVASSVRSLHFGYYNSCVPLAPDDRLYWLAA